MSLVVKDENAGYSAKCFYFQDVMAICWGVVGCLLLIDAYSMKEFKACKENTMAISIG